MELHQSGLFSVKSMYSASLANNITITSNDIWKLKLPLKIKIFPWFLHKGVTLTKDNVVKRNWHGNVNCCFCGNKETIQHFFSIAILLDLSGEPLMRLPLAYKRRATRFIYLVLGSWLDGWENKIKRKILVGVGAICWVIWLSGNDIYSF